ncbi:hypothetical protein SO802_021684 [Lithocarpus litseifolius]|uniref:Uncharacterized protein n=1 Tax=Lithocarpus litseifolius TaxID=425828 RepID=A0AAW2CFY4_9ROSI
MESEGSNIDNNNENRQWRAEEAIAGNAEALQALRELITFPLQSPFKHSATDPPWSSRCLLGEWSKGPHLTGYIDFAKSIEDHHRQFNKSFPWASWSNCPPPTLSSCRTKLEHTLESMVEKGVKLGTISSHQIFTTLSKWHGLNTALRRVIQSNNAASKSAVVDKASPSVLWDRAVSRYLLDVMPKRLMGYWV